ncbi:MAG: hypothetical protein M3R57_04995 [Chloroflexota bacterium]|nr:hypothetical protein [Chloroflexota bacterium]
MPASDALRTARFVSVSGVGNQYLGLGCVIGLEGCVQPAIWESPDGLEWQIAEPVFLPPDSSGGTVVAVASSALGTVAVGNVSDGDRTQASIWLRGDDGWAQVTPQSAGDSTIHALLATDRRAFAIGSGAFMEAAGFRAWWSPDGTTWQAAQSPPDELGGYPTGLLPVADRLLAWGPSCGGVCVPTTAWWVTADGTAWQAAKPPRGLEGASLYAISPSAGGFEAFGEVGGGDLPSRSTAWVADAAAAEWKTVPPLPDSDAIRIVQYLRVGGGSVAAGEGGGATGQAGYIWLRGPRDGTWRPPMQVALPDGDVDLVALIQHPEQLDRIIVIGRTFERLRERLVLWTGLVDWAP